ncbi:tigger transposable element-derived protein 4-like [Diorhabda carinulata]|uniref:tigger transposable element-derived protein 4-like n=1 Tax=Diorhabda carinulata TaxID=1163345 RepID=UPI0025A257CA|nr:tigger transposable element-derived protein 4-like [Diorhabda carinulata]
MCDFAKRMYKTLTLAEKVAISREAEKGVKKKSKIAEEFQIPRNTLSTFLKNKEKIISDFSQSSQSRKRCRGPENEGVEGCVKKWFKQARDKKVPVSGLIIQAKAQQVASSLNCHNFKASNGWLRNFKDRNDILMKAVCGEKAVVDMSKAEEWMQTTLQEKIKEVEPRNIFNVDETALFYECTPNKTFAFKGEDCSSGKLSKLRVTVLVGANVDGSEKLPLLVIGKSANPRCFKNVKTKPCEYQANKKAWMTQDIFENWLLKLDKKFYREKRKVLMFVDNCSAHNSIPDLENIEVVFFSPNMTSVLQPMDQGIINSFKIHYRSILVREVLDEQVTLSKNQVKVNILQALRMCADAWRQVSATTIKNGFRKAGFIRGEETSIKFEESILEEAKLDQDFINIDQNVAICGELSDFEILNEVQGSTAVELSDDEEENQEQLSSSVAPTPNEALEFLAKLREFAESRQDVDEDIFAAISKITRFASKEKIWLTK